MAFLVLKVLVKPRAKVSALTQAADGTFTARLKAPPVDGKANEELVALVARHFGCRKDDVELRGGASGRTKWIRVATRGGRG